MPLSINFSTTVVSPFCTAAIASRIASRSSGPSLSDKGKDMSWGWFPLYLTKFDNRRSGELTASFWKDSFGRRELVQGTTKFSVATSFSCWPMRSCSLWIFSFDGTSWCSSFLLFLVFPSTVTLPEKLLFWSIDGESIGGEYSVPTIGSEWNWGCISSAQLNLIVCSCLRELALVDSFSISDKLVLLIGSALFTHMGGSEASIDGYPCISAWTEIWPLRRGCFACRADPSLPSLSLPSEGTGDNAENSTCRPEVWVLVGCRRMEGLVELLVYFFPWGDLRPEELSTPCFHFTWGCLCSRDELPIVEVVETSELVRVRSELLIE